MESINKTVMVIVCILLAGISMAQSYNESNDRIESPGPEEVLYQWGSMGTGLSGSNEAVYVIATDENEIYIGGNFTDAGGDPTADYVARWNGVDWEGLDEGVNAAVNAMVISNGDLIIGGGFANVSGITTADGIARWDGQQWYAIGPGIQSRVDAIAVKNNIIYAGGPFINAGGNNDADYIAYYLNNQWHSLDQGITNGSVKALEFVGNDLFVGGDFQNAGNLSGADRIARWDGNSWHALDLGLNGGVQDIQSYENGVLAAGFFTGSGEEGGMQFIAYWDGQDWKRVGNEITSAGHINTVYEDSLGFYVGGVFADVGGHQYVDNIAKLEQGEWSSLSYGIMTQVYSIVRFNGGIIVGGSFINVNGIPEADRIATWTCNLSPTIESQSEMCAGSEIELIASIPGGQFTVINGPGIIEDNRLFAAEAGTITIEYSVTSLECSGTVIEEIVVVDSIDLAVHNQHDTIWCDNTGIQYQWVDCEENYAFIGNANDQFFVPSGSGSYAVIGYSEYCVDTSSCIEIILSSTLPDANSHTVQICPNPVSTIVTFHWPQNVSQPLIVEVYSYQGVRLSIPVENNFHFEQIDFSELPTGLYFIRIANEVHSVYKI